MFIVQIKNVFFILHIASLPIGVKFIKTIKPVSLGEENKVLYERWVESRRDEVEKLSDGRLGYAHVHSMSDAVLQSEISYVIMDGEC